MDQEIQSQESHSIKLPTFLTTVTPLSKTLAMALFIILPFAGFYLGIQYEKLVSTGSIKSSITPPLLIVSKYYQISPLYTHRALMIHRRRPPQKTNVTKTTSSL